MVTHTLKTERDTPTHSVVVNVCVSLSFQTESNHDTALTLACAGGHEELVSVLIARGANIEHRDKKGNTHTHNVTVQC